MTADVSPDNLQTVAAWTDAIAAMPSAGTWQGGTAGDDGVIQMPWVEYDAELRRFVEAATLAGFVQPVDWMGWAGTERARELIDDPGAIAGATTGELVLLMTTIVRGDRFSEGELEAALERGSLLAICRRAGVLAAGDGRG
jgi:hypothetical protein